VPHSITMNIWLDGPWTSEAWGGKRIGQIYIPANSPNEVTRFSVDVAQYVEHLEGKHAIFLEVDGTATWPMLNLIGLGFSSDSREITHPVAPTVSISVDGRELALPSHPLRSTPANPAFGFDVYEINIAVTPGSTAIPVVTAYASCPTVDISIEQINATSGTTFVRFDYNGMVKTYRIIFDPWVVWGQATEHRIVNNRPVYEGSARIAWADVIGFLDAGDPPGAVNFTINVPEAGTYLMHVMHTTPGSGASHYWQINDGEPIVFEYPQTDWTTTEFPEKIELDAGENTFRAQFRSGVIELRWVELQQYVGYPEDTGENFLPVLGWLLAEYIPFEEEPTAEPEPAAEQTPTTESVAETPIPAEQEPDVEGSNNNTVLIIVIAIIILAVGVFICFRVLKARSKKTEK